MTVMSALLSPRGRYGFRDIHLDISWLAGATFICGIASGRVINLIGDIYLGELLIIQLAILVMVFGRSRALIDLPVFGIFVQTAVLMLAGYIISDLYRDTHPGQFLRGWARVILTSLDFIALAVVVAQDKRNLWWFVLGMAVGSIGQLVVRGVPMMSAPGWKFGYSTPILYAIACLCYLLPMRTAAVIFAGMGVWNIYMDFRIMGGVSLLIAAVLWVRSRTPDGLSGYQTLKLIAACLVAGGIVAAALFATQEEFGQRRAGSNIGREAGIVVASRGIIESPIVGYGSWPNDPRLSSLYVEQVQEEGREASEAGGFSAHSMILQAWVEGGLLAVLFWIYYGLKMIGGVRYSILHRPADGYLPIFLFFLVYGLWHLVMSPFSGPTRLPTAVAITIICFCAIERVIQRGERRAVAALGHPHPA